MTRSKIPLYAAILICINTIFGAGIFINPKKLALLAGPYGIISYLVSACIIIPLLITIAELARLQPVSGGLYVYSREYISPFFGFLCGWAYFISKATSIAFLVHTLSGYFRLHFSVLQQYDPLYLDYAGIVGLALLNIAGVTIGSKIQYLFITMKIVPMAFALLVGIMCFRPALITMPFAGTCDFFATIPVCLYALIGFEAICSIGGFIENGSRNIRITLFTGFFIVTLFAILFQIIAYGVLGYDLAMVQEPISSMGAIALPSYAALGAIMQSIGMASILAGAFSMTATNCWNLYTIGQNKHFPFSGWLTRVTTANVPWVAVLVQASISVFMISIAREQLPLQNMVIFCIFWSFLLAAIAAYCAITSKRSILPRIIPILGMASCLYVLVLSCMNIMAYGVSLPFLCVLVGGCVLSLVYSAASVSE